MSSDAAIDGHYGTGGIMAMICDGLRQAGKDLDALAVDDLAPIDAFHTRGRASTLELAALADVQTSHKVLDVGCGLGGTARHLAHQYGCKVTGLDLTAEYVQVGNRLTEMVGLSDQVQLHQGTALDLPFADDAFDRVWTEHAQMNIADKAGFYRQIARVLKPGGQLLFHDIFRGPGEPPHYPAPWAEDASISALQTQDEARGYMQDAGLRIGAWQDKVADSIGFFQEVFAKIAADGPPPIGIHLLMGDTAKTKLSNYVTNLSEQRVTVAMGTATKEEKGKEKGTPHQSLPAPG